MNPTEIVAQLAAAAGVEVGALDDPAVVAYLVEVAAAVRQLDERASMTNFLAEPFDPRWSAEAGGGGADTP